MNPLLVRLGQAATRPGRSAGVLPEFLESYPTLGALMQGCEAANGNAAVPALTLRMFWEAEQLKACLGRHQYPQCVFAMVPDPCKALDSLELELVAGRSEVKRAKQ